MGRRDHAGGRDVSAQDGRVYSTENQGDKIREYAARRNIEIVRTYADEGKSGLRIDGRQALQQLIADVQAGKADFQIILVYDVSRWGRFQDADESAYYEYICRRAGIQVAYCAEQFENDGSPVPTIVKGIKRAMAGEYSRELSAKVFAGQCRLIELGFRQGGPAGYGQQRSVHELLKEKLHGPLEGNWAVTAAQVNLYYPPEPGRTRPKVVTIEVTSKGRLNLHKFDAKMQAQLEGYLVTVGILQKGQTLNAHEMPPEADAVSSTPVIED
ncbi:hypothetical protein AGMMS50256_32890 [Betaproteobacteria bacterium]|nr:hypothetical protein AGMMS50256_32890 [Betaproteobacteria bacterium]